MKSYEIFPQSRAMPKEQIIKNVTSLLQELQKGDASALDRLVSLVYDELCSIAKGHLKGEKKRHTLIRPTVLVHEAYVRLHHQRDVINLENRAQFFGIAARIMRQVLVDYVRERQAAKRGGQFEKILLDDLDALSPRESMDLMRINDALDELAQYDKKLSYLIELRFFAGLSIEETAKVLNSSVSTLNREWKFARAWLSRTLQADTGEKHRRGKKPDA